MPLPRISDREVVAMKIWIPETMTTDHKSGMCIHMLRTTQIITYVCIGFVMVSVDHPDAPPTEKVCTYVDK